MGVWYRRDATRVAEEELCHSKATSMSTARTAITMITEMPQLRRRKQVAVATTPTITPNTTG